MDVRSAILIPDLRPITGSELLNLVLIWDRIEQPRYPAAADPLAADERTATVAAALEERGMLVPTHAEPGVTPPPKPDYPETLSDLVSEQDMHNIMQWIVEVHLLCARDAVGIAQRRALAPLAIGQFGVIASAVPSVGHPLATAEATLITASVRGIALSPDTPVDDVVAFRDRHVAAIGRLRASLVDLAAAMNRDAAATAMAEEARAIIRNRVEPELAAVKARLNETRLEYALRTLTGAAGVGAGILRPTSTVELVVSALRYRWSRSRVVDEHPLGYLHQLGEFGQHEGVLSPGAEKAPVMKDEHQLREFFTEMGVEAHRAAASRSHK